MRVATRRVNEVAEVACRENCSNPPDVTSITTKASRPAVLAVMTTNPGFDGAVKTPCRLIEPAVVFQATVAPVTALPNWSVTMAPKSRVPPTATVVAGASMAIPTGGPPTSVRGIVREIPPIVAGGRPPTRGGAVGGGGQDGGAGRRGRARNPPTPPPPPPP